VISGERIAGKAGRRITENVSALPRGATHARPLRPRPRVWKSAITTSPWSAPASARRCASSFVDSSSSYWWILRPSSPLASSGAICASPSRSGTSTSRYPTPPRVWIT